MNLAPERSTLTLLIASILLLSACGGGGSSGGGTTTSSSSSTSSNTSNVPVENVAVPPEDSCAIAGFAATMLAAVNAARATARYCGSTWYSAAPALAWNTKLTQAAAVHSHDMAANSFLSHTGSNGSTLVNRVDATGYVAIAWGENISGGSATVDAVMAGWLASAGHCANIMNSTFRDFGAACARNDAAAYQRYWTQDFATPR
ncbi:MAG: CAP domain-containing protein [Rhodocyclales bacterium]|nr:CAP domain-containing protein [Rhodocyclales bacterium]